MTDPHYAFRAMRSLWGNEDYSASVDFLAAVSHYAQESWHDVVECGSGLSTLLLVEIVDEHRLTVLEHSPEWAVKLSSAVSPMPWLRMRHLEDKGEYDWYAWSPDGESLIDLVVCDGPPGDTRGGRYGALPELKNNLCENFVVLLDDVHRDAERETMERWAEEMDLHANVINADGRQFAILER